MSEHGAPQTSRPRLSVVIPVYNERATIETILQRVQGVTIEKEIIVVDDGSSDGTREFLQGLLRGSEQAASGRRRSPADQQSLRVDNLRVLFHERNLGKGAALRSGFQAARGEIVLIQDADLEYDPKDYAHLIRPIDQGLADAVFGSRFHGGPHRLLYYWHFVANKFLTLLSNMLTDLNMGDIWTGYKVFRREVLDELDLKENRFGVEVEITAKLAKGGWRVYEVPIGYYGRTYREGKKITWRDGAKSLWQILRYNLFVKRPPRGRRHGRV